MYLNQTEIIHVFNFAYRGLALGMSVSMAKIIARSAKEGDNGPWYIDSFF